MKIFLFVLVIVSCLISQEFNYCKNTSLPCLVEEGIVFKSDTMRVGEKILVRQYSTFTICVEGLDSGSIVVDGKLSELPVQTTSFGTTIPTSITDTGSAWYRLDSISTNGFYDILDSIKPSFVRFRLVNKNDFGTKVYGLKRVY